MSARKSDFRRDRLAGFREARDRIQAMNAEARMPTNNVEPYSDIDVFTPDPDDPLATWDDLACREGTHERERIGGR